MNQLVDISSGTSHHIEINAKATVLGITEDGDFNTEYPHSVALDLPSPITKHILRRKATKLWMKENLGAAFKPTVDDWYKACIPSVFQLSELSKQYVQPFLDEIAGRYTVGIHYRYVSDDPDADVLSVETVTMALENRFQGIDLKLAQHNGLLVVASDSDIVRNMLRERYKERIVMVDYLPLNTTNGLMNEASLMRNLIELQLLGQCDALYLTLKSKFSMVALAMNTKSASVEYFSYLCFDSYRVFGALSISWRAQFTVATSLDRRKRT